MTSPPQQDDQSISDDAVLLRRIPPWHFPPNRNVAERPSSAAFEDSPDGSAMSVDLEQLVEEHDLDPLTGYEAFGLVAFTAGEARQLGLEVFRWPLEDNPAHCGVAGTKTRGTRKQLARRARWRVLPGVELDAAP